MKMDVWFVFVIIIFAVQTEWPIGVYIVYTFLSQHVAFVLLFNQSPIIVIGWEAIECY